MNPFVIGSVFTLILVLPVRAEDRPLPRTLNEARLWWESEPAPAFTAPPSTPSSIRETVVETRKARLTAGAVRMSARMELPFEIAGFASDLRADEEYRLEEVPGTGRNKIVFSDAFWSNFLEQVGPDTRHHEYASYLLYVLLRASADVDYLRRYNPERCAWIVQGNAESLTPSLRVLRKSISHPPTSWLAPDGPVYQTNEQFRLTLEPGGNPTRTLQALVRYGLSALARRSADLYALETYEKMVGETPPLRVRRRVDERERVQAWDFSRARSAMTLAERLSFRQSLKNSYQVYIPES